ncbi:MAG: hypothetical protein OCC45_08665 [Desulfotalea sp.]
MKNQRDIKFIKKIRQLSDDPEEIIAYVKNSQAILKPKWWKIVHTELDESSSEKIQYFLKDGNALRTLHDKAVSEANRHKLLLDELLWEELLATFAIYLETLYFEVKSDQQFDAKRLNLIPVLQRVAAEKIKLPKRKWHRKRDTDAVLHSVIFDSTKAEHTEAYLLFNSWDFVLEVEAIINNFCFKGWNVSYDNGLTIKPNSPDIWKAWNTTNHKFQIIDHFYREIVHVISPEFVDEVRSKAPNEVTINHNIGAMGGSLFIKDMLGVDEVVFDKITIDLFESILLISGFDACYKNKYLPFMEKYKKEGLSYRDSTLRNMSFFSDSFPCIFARTSKEMLEIMMQYDQVIPDATRRENCLAVLDLFSGPPHMGGIDSCQFIRSPENNYIIMPRFFHGDVKTALLNSIIRKKGREKGKGNDGNKPFSVNMENSLAQRFNAQGYQTISSWNYEDKDSQKGEIDVVAYKAGYLFIIEAKLTFFRNQVEGIYRHEQDLIKAAKQLIRGTRGVNDNFNELRSKLAITEDFPDLQIVPLIVSSSPEFDYKKYSGIPKLSQFELQCLLDPSAYALACHIINFYNLGSEVVQGSSTEESILVAEKLTQDRIFLENHNNLEKDRIEGELIASQPKRLIDAINSKKFWKNLEENINVVSGPAEQILTMKNGEKVSYVI